MGRPAYRHGMFCHSSLCSTRWSTNSMAFRWLLKRFPLKVRMSILNKQWWTFFTWKLMLKKLGHLNIWLWKPSDATCGLLIARQEQLQVGDQVIARVTGTEARLPNFEVQKLQKFVIPSMSIAWGFDSGITHKYTNEHTLLRKITIYIEYNTKLSLFQQASFPSPRSLPSFTCSATASSSSLATPRLRRANGLGSSLMKRQDNLNGGKCGSVVNLGFDGFQHLFWKQIWLSTTCQQSSKLRLFIFWRFISGSFSCPETQFWFILAR